MDAGGGVMDGELTQEEHAIMKSHGRELKERCRTQEEVMDQEVWRRNAGSEVMNRTHGGVNMQRILQEASWKKNRGRPPMSA